MSTTIQLFLGSYTHTCRGFPAHRPGIGQLHFDQVNGKIETQATISNVINPSWLLLHPNGQWLYTVSEVDQTVSGRPGGELVAFNLVTGQAPIEIHRFSTTGASPCHLAFSADHQNLYCANYGGASTISFSLGPQGELSPGQYLAHADFATPSLPSTLLHPHQVIAIPDSSYLVCIDLGANCLLVFEPDSAANLVLAARLPLSEGSGPRHALYHAPSSSLYIVGEYLPLLMVVSCQGKPSSWQLKTAIPSLPHPAPSPSDGAAIKISADGLSLYLTSRGDANQISHFRYDTVQQQFIMADCFDCGGVGPRDIWLCPSGKWLIVANQHSDSLAVLARNPISGSLEDTQYRFPWPCPSCITSL